MAAASDSASGSSVDTSSMDSAYDAAYAKYYDEQFSEDSREMNRQILDFVAGQTVPAQSMMDVGCGTGHLLEAFGADERFAAWKVAGFDLSTHMARAAQLRLGDRGTVTVDSATTWTAPDGPSSLGLVLSTFNPINHFPHAEDVGAAFERAAAALAPGGLVVVDILTRLGFDRLIMNTLEEDEKGTGKLYMATGARIDADTVALRELCYLPVGKDGLFRRADSHVVMHFREPAAVAAAAEAAGLTDVRVYGGYDRLEQVSNGDGEPLGSIDEELQRAKDEEALEIVITATKPASA